MEKKLLGSTKRSKTYYSETRFGLFTNLKSMSVSFINILNISVKLSCNAKATQPLRDLDHLRRHDNVT